MLSAWEILAAKGHPVRPARVVLIHREVQLGYSSRFHGVIFTDRVTKWFSLGTEKADLRH